jgi:hypothetical protein
MLNKKWSLHYGVIIPFYFVCVSKVYQTTKNEIVKCHSNKYRKMCCLSARRLSNIKLITCFRLSLLNNCKKDFQFHIKTPRSILFFTINTNFLMKRYVTWLIWITRFWALLIPGCRLAPFSIFFWAQHKILNQTKPKNIKIGQYFTWKWKSSQKFVLQLPGGICFWSQNWNLTPVRPIPSVIQKEKFFTWKDLSKGGRSKFFTRTALTAKQRKYFFRKHRPENRKKKIGYHEISTLYWLRS